MNKKIKVAMVAANLELNGISSVIMNYCRNIDKNRFEITIFAGSPINEKYREECENLNITIIELSCKRKSKMKYYLDLFSKVKKKEFDIFHVHGNSAVMAFDLMVAYLKKIKIRIAHSHNTICDNQKVHKILSPIFKKLYTNAFACGEKAGNWLFGKDNFTIINNGINLEKFLFNASFRSEIRNKLNIKDDEFVIGHIGRINYQKNQTFLLEVFESLCAQNKKIKLLSVGVGPLFEKFKERVSNSQFKDNIILYGESNETEKFYMAMDVFVFPSRYEGLPVTLIEAQVSGLKCVVSDKITDEIMLTNLISKVSIERKEKWIKFLNLIFQDKNLKQKRTIGAENFEKFDIEKNVLELQNYYKKFVEEV